MVILLFLFSAVKCVRQATIARGATTSLESGGCLKCRAVILLGFLHLFPMNKSGCWASCSWYSALLLFPSFHLFQCLWTDGCCWLPWLSPQMPVFQGSAEDALGSSAALSRHSASIPADESWANPSELWGSYWVFTHFFNSARTSVYIPLLTFSWEQKCIPNFLHSNFACSILMRVAVTLHGLFPRFVVSTGIHHFYSLNYDSFPPFLPFHPLHIRMSLSVGYSPFLMLTKS